MRMLNLNKRLIYYANYQGEEPILDEHGHKTGEVKLIYSEPIPIMANVSAAKGESSIREFGNTLQYDRTIILKEYMPLMMESSILWVDDLDISKKHDYVVNKIARSINSASIAISKVDVGA